MTELAVTLVCLCACLACGFAALVACAYASYLDTFDRGDG